MSGDAGRAAPPRAAGPTLPHSLPTNPQLPRQLRSRLVMDFERFKRGLPADVPAHARERYRVDLTGSYAGRRVRVPFGKASGQLSMTAPEVRADAEAGLGFVVLKTVIAQDAAGTRSMEAWAVHESAMRVEPMVAASGRAGWTVTWKGRGWDRSFEDYLALYREALVIAAEALMPVAASVKYDLPVAGVPFREAEYDYTTRALAEVGGPEMILEKDFSPTLAGDARAGARQTVLRWLRDAPALVKCRAPLTLGLKLMNALMGDDFQVEMLRAAADNPDVDFVVLFNRLFDPERSVAYGGWDLSDRNLRVLDLYTSNFGPLGFCATGNICSGRMMVEYALRGATSGQIHTFFQLPLGEYPALEGDRTARALHALLYHPEDGLIAWLAHLGETGSLAPRQGLLHFLDIAHGTTRHPG